jgi:hypothetical protein
MGSEGLSIMVDEESNGESPKRGRPKGSRNKPKPSGGTGNAAEKPAPPSDPPKPTGGPQGGANVRKPRTPKVDETDSPPAPSPEVARDARPTAKRTRTQKRVSVGHARKTDAGGAGDRSGGETKDPDGGFPWLVVVGALGGLAVLWYLRQQTSPAAGTEAQPEGERSTLDETIQRFLDFGARLNDRGEFIFGRR